jgi:serine/threonine protein kinase
MLRSLRNLVNPKKHCKKCGKKYTNVYWRWCKPCLINDLKTNSSGNEKIDNFVQGMQLKIESPGNIAFEWIPYNQFSDIEEIGRGGFTTVYSAIWKDGLLKYTYVNEAYTRESNQNVALKCLHNSQNITNEFLNEV